MTEILKTLKKAPLSSNDGARSHNGDGEDSGSQIEEGNGSEHESYEGDVQSLVASKSMEVTPPHIVYLEDGEREIESCSQLLKSLPLPNVRWICPTAPTRPVSLFGGFPCAAWFDAQDVSEDALDDLHGLDASAAHVANLLSTEPADIKLGIGGFSMGAATALYSATCHVFGQYSNRDPYLVKLSCVVGLSGWLPCSRMLRNRMERSNEMVRRAASLPILLCHGSGDDVVAYKHGENSARVLSSAGFQNLMFRSYAGLGHYTIPEEMDEVRCWLVARLGLQGS